MSSRMKDFDPTVETWKRFVQRVKFYFVEEGIDESEINVLKRKAILFRTMGIGIFNKYCNIHAGEVEDATFEEIVERIEAIVNHRLLEIAERFHFYTRQQQRGENAADYMAALRKLASTCNFQQDSISPLNGRLRDQFVCGILNADVQKYLLQQQELTVDNVVTIAASFEAAEKTSVMLQGSASTPSYSAELSASDNYESRRSNREFHGRSCNHCGKLQEFRTGATSNNMESVLFKEESKRLRDQVQALRDQLNDTENKYAQAMRDLENLRREKEERECDLEHRNFELSDQCIKLQAEMEALLKELQLIIDAKLGLELEIITYRRLLNGEESRAGLRQITDSILNSGETQEYTIRQTKSASGNNSMKVMKGEMSPRTTIQKSAKGPVAIYECSQDGKYVALENTGRKNELLGSWSLTRNIDGKDSATYKFNDSFVLRPSQQVKVWAKGTRPFTGAVGDIESDRSWGIGAHIITKLVNPLGEDRAIHDQQTKYA